MPVFLTIISISQLYFTVLAYSSVMISYLLIRGYSQTFLAVMRGLSVVFGLAATFTTPSLTKRVGPIGAGMWGVWSETVCLVPVVISFWIDIKGAGDGTIHSVVAPILFFSGVTLSRVAEEDIGLLSGVQVSLQNVFDLLGYASTIKNE
eukprot:jgi/Hompol1/6259/HPOL_004928-RA